MSLSYHHTPVQLWVHTTIVVACILPCSLVTHNTFLKLSRKAFYCFSNFFTTSAHAIPAIVLSSSTGFHLLCRTVTSSNHLLHVFLFFQSLVTTTTTIDGACLAATNHMYGSSCKCGHFTIEVHLHEPGILK